MLTVIFYLLSLFGIITLSLLTFLRRSEKSSTYFSLLSFAISAWLFIQFLAIRIPEKAYGLTIAGLVVFCFVPIFCFLFAIEFTGSMGISEKNRKIITAMTFMTMSVLTFVPGTVEQVKVVEGALVINTGLGYAAQSLIAVMLVIYSMLIIAINYSKFNESKKKATYYLVAGILIAVVGNLVSGFIYSDRQNLQFIGPMSLFVMSAMVTFAITRHKLFDVRFVIFRSFGYIFSLATIAAIAFASLSYLSSALEGYGVTDAIQRTIFVALTLILAASYQPFKKLFDALTSKLFYRDAYETQTLLNEFNQVIVSTIDLNQLLMRAGVTIERFLKPEGVSFAIRDSEEDVVRIISTSDDKISKEVIEQVRAYVHKSPEKLFVTDALEDSQGELKLLLQEANIGMLARITTDINVEGNGYIVMGYKKSGNMYNTQDTGAMEIIANELAIAMQNALQFEEIQKFNVTLQDTVEEKTRQLRKSNEKLKQMDETKDEFISMASHQLRTPLTSVKGYVSMVIEGDAGELNPMQKKLLDQAFVSSQRMVYLIADLLNVSRLRTGKFVIDSAPTNLADVIQGEVEQLVETAESRGLELKYTKQKDFPTLMLDETKIRQVVMNFIDNAIYYTPSGGHIKVELKDTGKTIEYTVTDDGLGVPKAQQHHLFSKFFRAENAKKARPDGTGLGLFMARKVIVAQGGSLIFKSTEGKGSTFGFSFDKAKLAVPDHYEAPEDTHGIKFGPKLPPK